MWCGTYNQCIKTIKFRIIKIGVLAKCYRSFSSATNAGRLKSLYCSESAPQKGLSELCPYVCYDRCTWLPALLSYFFCQSFAFWCNPSTCEDKGIEWRLLYFNHSLVVLILDFFFILLVDLCQGLPRIWLWGRMCDPYVKESFLTAIPQSSCIDIQPCIVSNVDFFYIHFRYLAEVWIQCEHTYRPLSLSVLQSLSLSCASLKCSHLIYIWGCDPEFVSPQPQ